MLKMADNVKEKLIINGKPIKNANATPMINNNAHHKLYLMIKPRSYA